MEPTKVYTNGFPKSGNHALVKAVELLGLPASVNHTSYKEGLPSDHKHILIKRDPRNIVVSMLRFQSQSVTPGMFITRFRQFVDRTLVQEMAEFEPWLTDKSTLVVEYERLISNPREIRRIANYLRTPYIDGAYEELPGNTMTWHATHSNFAHVWTHLVDQVWRGEGGPELMKRWGYDS